MSSTSGVIYPPPYPAVLPIFNPENYLYKDQVLTLALGDARYVKKGFLASGGGWGDYLYWSGTKWIAGSTEVRIGRNAGFTNQGNDSVAIGDSAGSFNQSQETVALGVRAGQTNQGFKALAIGTFSGRNFQGQEGIAIGNNAGSFTQGNVAVAIGASAANSAQKSGAIAIGFNAAIGQQGTNAIAIGVNTCFTGQGENAIAIGQNVGNRQGNNSIAIGTNAGRSGQLAESIAIGVAAGNTNQGSNCIAIGRDAGQNGQGNNAIAIGQSAASTNQHPRSIFINASGTAFNTDGTDRCFIHPIRNSNAANPVLEYITGTKEVVYDSSSQKYKINIQNLTRSTENLHQLRLVEFDNKEEPWKHSIGLIAEEVNAIDPILCFHNEDGSPEGIVWKYITTYLIGEVQKLRKELNEVKSLKNKI